MTGVHFLGCKSYGTYDRHDHVAQVALSESFFRYELIFTGSLATSSVGSNFTSGCFCGWGARASTQTDSDRSGGASHTEKIGL